MLLCLEELKSVIIKYFTFCRTHYTLLHYLADLFKLFILLNYVYFAYMIFAQLFLLLNNYFEKKKAPSKPERYSNHQCPEPDYYTRKQSRCTCQRPSEKECPPARERSRSKPKCPLPSGGTGPSLCNLLFKKSKPASTPCPTKSTEKIAPCSSSVERIQVEFNCKPKRSKKTRDGRIPKSRSCTKCGKSLTEPKQSKQCASRPPQACRRRRGGNDSDCEDEFGVRR